MKCSFCGHEFAEEEARRSCANCSRLSSCRLLCCPNCGYRIPPEPGFMRFLRRGRHRHRHGQESWLGDGIPLTSLRAGQSGVITALDTTDKTKLNKLMALGILPGAQVRVVQEHPVYVFDVGNTQAAVDKEVAGRILVQRVC